MACQGFVGCEQTLGVNDGIGRLWGALAVSGLQGRMSEKMQDKALQAMRSMAEDIGRKLPVVGPAIL